MPLSVSFFLLSLLLLFGLFRAKDFAFVQCIIFFFFLRAAPVAYGSSQARGQIGMQLPSHIHSRSHSHTGSKHVCDPDHSHSNVGSLTH